MSLSPSSPEPAVRTSKSSSMRSLFIERRMFSSSSTKRTLTGCWANASVMTISLAGEGGGSVQNCGEQVVKFGVEYRFLHPVHDPKCRLPVVGLAVRAVGGEGVIDIGNRNDPCLHGDAGSVQPIGISGAVESFMVIK